MCATECSSRCHARRDGRAMWVACNCARFPAIRPHVFCELKIMKIVILIDQIIQEKFAFGELFVLVMIGYIFMFKMVKKMQNSGLEMVAGLTRSLSKKKKKEEKNRKIYLIFENKNDKMFFKQTFSLAFYFHKFCSWTC